jgi:uncharacterized protein (TIGR03437 family)
MKHVLWALMLASLLTVAGFGQATDTFTYSYSGPPLQILPTSTGIITVAEIAVPRAVQITSVTAKVQIQYPVVGDLNVYLFSAQNTRTKLLERNCGSLVNVDTTFDDAAAQKYSSFCPQEAGRGPYQGNEPLANSKGQPSLGYWQLAVQNNGGNNNTGWVTGFSLTITGTLYPTPQIGPNTILNSASYFGGSIAPGEKVSIFGATLGPATPVSATTPDLPTTLGGTTVTISGVAVPISYSSSFRVDVQVPYAVVPGSTVPVVVSYGGSSSSTANMDVVPAYPGIYTATGQSAGQAKAINADGSLNSTAKPATRGSIITLYASGLGSVVPVIPAGSAPPSSPLSICSETVSVYIGGIQSKVWYSGTAPGYAGLYQLNVEVPSGVQPGTRKITVSAGGLSSQQGVTVEVQ